MPEAWPDAFRGRGHEIALGGIRRRISKGSNRRLRLLFPGEDGLGKMRLVQTGAAP